jgi:hypothetical protein
MGALSPSSSSSALPGIQPSKVAETPKDSKLKLTTISSQSTIYSERPRLITEAVSHFEKQGTAYEISPDDLAFVRNKIIKSIQRTESKTKVTVEPTSAAGIRGTPMYDNHEKFDETAKFFLNPLAMYDTYFRPLVDAFSVILTEESKSLEMLYSWADNIFGLDGVNGQRDQSIDMKEHVRKFHKHLTAKKSIPCKLIMYVASKDKRLIRRVLQLGPFAFHWSEDGLCIPSPFVNEERTFGEGVFFMGNLITDGVRVDKVIFMGICEVIARFNREKEYNPSGFNIREKGVCSVTFFEEFIRAAVVYSTQTMSECWLLTGGDSGHAQWTYVHHVYNSTTENDPSVWDTRMIYSRPGQFTTFTTHYQLDDYVRDQLNYGLIKNSRDSSEWELLKSFDRAFHARVGFRMQECRSKHMNCDKGKKCFCCPFGTVNVITGTADVPEDYTCDISASTDRKSALTETPANVSSVGKSTNLKAILAPLGTTNTLGMEPRIREDFANSIKGMSMPQIEEFLKAFYEANAKFK